MTAHRPPALIVVGASAGGIEALIAMVEGLPPDLPAAVCVVVHFPPSAASLLPEILTRAGRLPARHARHGDQLEAGCIYVAPPVFHLLVMDGRIHLSRSPRENNHRPAIDPLFRSAARAYGPRLAGVILSGALDDGALGMAQVKRRGGAVVVQDPRDAVFDAMPRNALEAAPADLVLPASRIGPALAELAVELASHPPPEVETMPQDDEPRDAKIVADDKAALEQGGRSGEPTMLTCPDCGGVLWEFSDNGPLRFRCHVGHTYSAGSMQAGMTESLETALWTALRTLEESAALARRLAHRSRQRNHGVVSEHFESRAALHERHAEVIRQTLTGLDVSPAPPGMEAADDS